jgi:Tat (twin-arginine translocation) pathway signal sequence
MTFSRRRFLGASATMAGAGMVDFPGKHTSSITFRTHSQADPAANPPIELIALNRMAYGPRPGDVARVQQMGFAAYVDEQLNPNDADDALCNQKIADARLRIQYNARDGVSGSR